MISLLVGVVITAIPLLHLIFTNGDGAHDFARLCEVALLPVVTLLLIPRASAPGRKTTNAVLAALLIWVLIGIARSSFPTVALRELLLFVGLGLMALGIASESPARQRWLLGALVFAAFSYGVVYVLGALALLLDGQRLSYFALVFGFDNPRFLNHTQTLVFPLAISAMGMTSNRIARAGAGIAAALAAFMAFALAARATLVADLIAMLLALLIFRRPAWPWVKTAAGAMLAGLVLWGVFQLTGAVYVHDGYAPGLESLAADHSRLKLWKLAWNDSLESWWGIGPMHFAARPNGTGAHPHNFYLQLAAEWGWPFTICVVAGIAAGWHRLRRRLVAQGPALSGNAGLGLFAACTAMAIDAALSGSMTLPLPQLWCFAVMGLAAGWYRTAGGTVAVDAGEETPKASIPRRLGLLAVTALLATMFATSWTEYWARPDPKLTESRFKARAIPGEMSPRFWLHGWF